MKADERGGVVALCVSCRFAEWRRTSNGRRHPDGSGTCRYEFPDAPLPKWALEWSHGNHRERLASQRALLNQKFPVRYVYRLDYHRTEPAPCATWEAATNDPAVVTPVGTPRISPTRD